MTEAEAIKWIDDRMCYGRYIPQKHNPFVHDECCQAGEMAINALEKQIAKKPKMRHVKPYDNYNDGWCPCCGGYVQEEEYDTYYCQRCGQRLKWTDSEV